MTNRILSCPIPENINPLSPNGYMFTVQKLPKLSYFAQQVVLPTISLGAAEVQNPFVTVPQPGERLEFQPLTIDFLVDQNMDNYKAINDWMMGLGFPENYEQYSSWNASDEISGNQLKKNSSDASLIVLGNHNNPIQTIQFYDIWPESLQSLTFVSNVQDVQYLVGSVTFRYSHYKFV